MYPPSMRCLKLEYKTYHPAIQTQLIYPDPPSIYLSSLKVEYETYHGGRIHPYILESFSRPISNWNTKHIMEPPFGFAPSQVQKELVAYSGQPGPLLGGCL